ncbi:hypothetical protein PR258_01205 [Metamycoplasma hyosynoviae]|nr:hypothetical protein [Metamycoplasma hyosynoviae]
MLFGFVAAIFNLIIISLSFNKDFPKVTQRATIFFAGVLLALFFLSIYVLIVQGGGLSGKQVDTILLFVFYLILLILITVTCILHLVRVLSKNRVLYN